MTNLESRRKGLAKLEGREVKVVKLGFDPSKHPNIIYVPLPEYGFGLLYEYEDDEPGDGLGMCSTK